MVAARMNAGDVSDGDREQHAGPSSLKEAVSLVTEALEAIALAEKRTTDAETLNDQLIQHSSEQVRYALLQARHQQLRAEFAERKVVVLRDCLRMVSEALKAATG